MGIVLANRGGTLYAKPCGVSFLFGLYCFFSVLLTRWCFLGPCSCGEQRERVFVGCGNRKLCAKPASVSSCLISVRSSLQDTQNLGKKYFPASEMYYGFRRSIYQSTILISSWWVQESGSDIPFPLQGAWEARGAWDCRNEGVISLGEPGGPAAGLSTGNEGVPWDALIARLSPGSLLLGWKLLLFILPWSRLTWKLEELSVEVTISLLWFWLDPESDNQVY